LKAALFFALAVAGILFGISNQDNANVHFYWYFSKTYPLYLILFACFVAGTLTSIIYVIISGSDMKDENRRLNKRMEDLMNNIKKANTSRSSFTPPGSTDGTSGSTP
jgi:uncharacterized integral membrane protein